MKLHTHLVLAISSLLFVACGENSASSGRLPVLAEDTFNGELVMAEDLGGAPADFSGDYVSEVCDATVDGTKSVCTAYFRITQDTELGASGMVEIATKRQILWLPKLGIQQNELVGPFGAQTVVGRIGNRAVLIRIAGNGADEPSIFMVKLLTDGKLGFSTKDKTGALIRGVALRAKP